MGKAWANVVSFAKKESEKQAKLTEEELYSQINEMISLENTMSEEYLSTLHLKILQFQIADSQLDSAITKKLLEYIVEDESRHKVLLGKIAEINLKKQLKNSDC